MEIDNFSQSPFDRLLSVLKYLDSYAELFLLPHYINILSYIQDKIIPISRKATILIFVCDCF